MRFLLSNLLKKPNIISFFGIRKLSNTIFSLSSGVGKCGVSIIRVSGPSTLTALQVLVKKPKWIPKPRYAFLTSFFHPNSDELIDRGLLLWFPGPKSFTGEDSCEFQVHGSLAVIAAMNEALSEIPDLRMAMPGEFTKRSFLSGKLDLTEVEGLADLIHAETEAQRKQALLQSTGNLSKLYKNWRQQIIRCMAHLEAYIDFAEDENIEDNVMENVVSELEILKSQIYAHLNDNRKGEILRDGARTVIIGEPNVGKSSLLNTICEKSVSIVTPFAGTTRDIIETSINIGGYPVVFADTAGLRIKTNDCIEAEGISRAINYIQTANLVILIISAVDFIKFSSNFDTYRDKYLEEIGLKASIIEGKKLVTVLNKIDLLNEMDLNKLSALKNINLISCKSNLNIEKFLQHLTDIYSEICGQPTVENPRLTQSRYRESLKKCHDNLEDFLLNITKDPNQDLAIAAQKLRQSVRCIETITGHISTDDILDVIFRDFCIGK